MKVINRILFYKIFIILISLSLVFCAKQNEFLNEKPNVSLSTISTLADCQLLINNENVFNVAYSSLGQISTDDYYLLDGDWLNESPTVQNAYIWAKTIYPANVNIKDWSGGFQKIYYANTVLDALSRMKISADEINQFNHIKGAALFFRSYASYDLLQVFSPQYDSINSISQLGIPEHINSNPDIINFRSSEYDCYHLLIQDIISAIPLLPVSVSFPTEPSKAGAFGLLTRVYMIMGDYKEAGVFADSCLKYNSSLTDYNLLTPEYNTLIPNYSGYLNEDIFHATLYSQDPVIPHYIAITDSLLYNSYDSNDLRKSIFYNISSGLPYFTGSYDYKGQAYCGIASDEILLTRAECFARSGDFTSAMTMLNKLLKTRWLTGTFTNYVATDANDALTQILLERRKELSFRGLRWIDLRRLNKNPATSKLITRNINGGTYSLPPNDPRYVLPIPDNEIQLSGIQQNQR